ncbi:hypothetical protein B0H16DRAFT_1895283 [Mycena metata]|uniref:Uncharacterized protein n=1 Tax=Mycena metata TaxID=1033252 RepID=A0AAD7HQ43_9AGAR|nr:hypothetical protein B0H16DRAFT_1895283 [Mycena metata]
MSEIDAELEIDAAELEELNRRCDACEQDIAYLKKSYSEQDALHSFWLPTTKAIVYSVLLRVAAAHYFWAARLHRWPTPTEVRVLGAYLANHERRFPDPNITIEDRVTQVLGEQAVRRAQAPDAEGFELAKFKEERKAPLPELVSSLQSTPGAYPEGRGAPADFVPFIRDHYPLTVEHAPCRYTAQTIAGVLSFIGREPSESSAENQALLAGMKQLYTVIFGFSYDTIPALGAGIVVEDCIPILDLI